MVIHFSCMCIMFNFEIDRFVCFCRFIFLLLSYRPFIRSTLLSSYILFRFLSSLMLLSASYIFNACLSAIICLLFLLFLLFLSTIECNSKCMTCASCAQAPKLFSFFLSLQVVGVVAGAVVCLLYLLPAYIQRTTKVLFGSCSLLYIFVTIFSH